nr:carbonic anhydrase [Clostridium polyendosporum]
MAVANVLGHDRCGAVKAAIDGGDVSPNVEAIVRNITPAVEYIKSTSKNAKAEEIAPMVENENILRSINRLLESSVIKKLEYNGNIDVIPAKYNMATGKVTFLGDFQHNLRGKILKV